MPKLLQINVTANWGSTGKIAEQIGLKAMDRGWESYIVYGRNSNPSKSKLIKVGCMLNVYEHYLENRLFDNEGLASRIPTKNLIKQIEKLKPDIIHLHNIHDHWLNYKIIFEYFNSIDTPIVWTQHDCWAFTGGCGYFDAIDCKEWQNGCLKCLIKKSEILNRSNYHFENKKKLFSKIKSLTFVPVSNWLGDIMKISSQGNREIQVIHNGIDIQQFRPILSNNGNKFRVIGVALPWSKRKGLDDILKLRALLDDQYEIILVGLTEKQIKNMPNGIVGITRTSSIEELARLYSSANVFINPTYSDNFPTVNIEALSCGTPVITYKTGGSPEAIDTNTGVVVEQGDVKAMADAIKQMKLNPLSSEACRKRAVEYFDKNKCFDKYIDLYEKLLEISCMK